MKLQKLESKQVPQVIGLGVLVVAALGWAGFQYLSTPAPKPTPKDLKSVQAQADPATQPPDGQKQPDLVLPGQYNPDPFKPAVQPDSQRPAPTTTVVKSVKPHGGVETAQVGPTYTGDVLPPIGPGVGPQGGGVEPPLKPAVPPPPPLPTPPDVAVTGIIDAPDGKDMALVELSSDHRIVQEGDLVANNFRVKAIKPNGLVLVNGKVRVFVGLGNKKEEAAKRG